MKLLFISMNARTINDNSGSIYLNAHTNKETIQRYRVICDELRMTLRDSGICYAKEEARKKYDPFPKDLADLNIRCNPYHPIANLFSVKEYREINRVFLESIKWADKVIITSAIDIYVETGIKYCKAYNKGCMLLVGGFTLETNWNHGWDGKFAVWKYEHECKRNMATALYGLYMTREFLQKRYPCHGKTIGCSDAKITDLSPDILRRRLEKTASKKITIILGTITNIDDEQKGHGLVIGAISLLKQRDHKFEYHLLGAGSGASLMVCAEQLGVKGQTILDGTEPHSEVYMWFDDTDIYIQPGFAEGLYRAVMKTTSRTCPVICTDAGDNDELCSREFLVGAGNTETIVGVLEKLIVAGTCGK